MNIGSTLKWIKTSVLAMLGGGFTAAVAAMFDPSKYSFPHDLGSGKLWRYVFAGWGLTFGALLIHSPLGQKTLAALKDLQAQLAQSKADLEQAKAELKACMPPAGPSEPDVQPRRDDPGNK
jgi:hypothetical protein